jgi:hypothetical protein
MFHVFAPVNRFRVSDHGFAQFSAVFAQFSAVCTVPDALGVHGTRSTFFAPVHGFRVSVHVFA